MLSSPRESQNAQKTPNFTLSAFSKQKIELAKLIIDV